MFDALLSLFVFGGLWFWGLLVVASIILISCLERECEGGATFVFLVASTAVVFGNTNWITYIIENPLSIGLLIGAYLLIGVGWGICKWWIYLDDVSTRNRTERYEWVAMRKAEMPVGDEDYPAYEAACVLFPPQRWPDEVKKAWKQYVKRVYYGKIITKPMVSEHKAQIISWMTYWPWSALWTLINDPIRRFYRKVCSQLSGLLQGMSDKAFKDLDE